MSGRYETTIPVRWSDTDMLGHVNAARYLTFMEELMAEWWTPVFGDDYVVVRMELDFDGEIPHGTRSVAAAMWVEKLGTSSVTLRTEIRREDGEPAFRAVSVAVIWDPVARRSRALTDRERQWLEPPEKEDDDD